MTDPTPGDIVVVTKEKTFPRTREQEFRVVVEKVESDRVYCGVDGWINRDRVVRVVGPSPSYT